MFSLQNVNFEYRVNRMLYPTLTYPPDIYIQFGEKKVWFVGPRGLNSVGETEKGETHYALCFLLVRGLETKQRCLLFSGIACVGNSTAFHLSKFLVSAVESYPSTDDPGKTEADLMIRHSLHSR